MKITPSDYEHFFPFRKPRDEQRQAIEFALNSFLEGKKNVIIQAPTGVGKSGIAVTVAKALDTLINSDEKVGSYVLTTQKVLQDQYIEDFARCGVASIKSASSYTCGRRPDQSCGETRRLLKVLRENCGKDIIGCKHECVYLEAKTAFLNSRVSVTNFSYFLAETMYAKALTPRTLLVCDECHNIEASLGSFIEIVFSHRFAKHVLKINMPSRDEMLTVVEWIKNEYKPALVAHIAGFVKEIAELTEKNEDVHKLARRYEELDKHICKVNRFIDEFDPSNWVMNTVVPEKPTELPKYEFKPVDVSTFSQERLFRFGDYVLLMSATVLDKDTFCNSIGLDPQETAYLELSSPFDPKNRPVHYFPIGSMSRKSINVTLPLAAQAVKTIIDQHKNEKGIVHCTTFQIAKFIKENVRSDRFLIHTSEDREAVLERHKKGKKPTILLSPSMTEGIDLVGDQSRFQILMKVPFPYLGDEVTRKRMEKNRKWYNLVTARTIIQSLGRSVRNERDHAVSYIIDGDWERFYSQNKAIFPLDFKAAYDQKDPK